MNRLRYISAWRYTCLVLLVLSVLLPAELLSAGTVSPEYKLKAALIYKLTKFVEWPRSSQEKKQFGICILGRNDFGSALDALEARQVGNQPIHIQHFSQSEAVNSSCQILFVSESKRPFLKTILHSLAHLPILTIGDIDKFAEMGGMIELNRGHKRIGFRINLQQADRAGLKIAAPLLDLATIVETIQP